VTAAAVIEMEAFLKKVSVIISNTNTRDVLKECLGNLRHLVDDCHQNIEVIVVDNKSNDGSADMVKSEYPFVNLIVTPNYGLANGCNLGAKIATGDYLLFLGEDGFPQEHTLPGLIEYLESHENIGLATAKLVLRDGSPDLDVHRRFPTPGSAFARLFMLSKLFPKSTRFNGYFMLDQDHSKEHEIEMCITHFMFIPRPVFDQVGGFDDKNYFVYGEDADICYKIKENGYKLMYLPQYEAGHYKGAAMGNRKETADLGVKTLAWKNFMHFNATRAQRVFVKKFLVGKYPLIIIWFMLFGTYILEIQRQASETLKHIKKHGFNYINDDYTRISKLTLEQRFDF
jgi:N-acetylglucosaminyl-diphospho-decaprenol L-rhamnosyltransferase